MKCSICGKGGLFRTINESGLCKKCAASVACLQTEPAPLQAPKERKRGEQEPIDFSPRLCMITPLQKQPNFSVKEARKIIGELNTLEYDEAFEDMGFPHDDGVRAYSRHEAEDKLCFFSDRLFEKRGQYKNWVLRSTAPGVYVQNYDLYMQTLAMLARMEKLMEYYEPLPSEEIKAAVLKKPDYDCDMIDRAWDAALRRADKRKTEQGKRTSIEAFAALFKPYRAYLCEPALLKLDTLVTDMLHTSDLPAAINAIASVAKPVPEFDSEKESVLLEAYHAAEDDIRKHLARIQLCDFYYKYRAIEKFLNLCITLCLEDIISLDSLDVQERAELDYAKAREEEWGTLNDESRARYESDYAIGFNGRIPSFDKLIMIMQHKKDYAQALAYCDLAIAHSKTHCHCDVPASEYAGKRQRVEKAMQKDACSQPARG